MDLPILRSFRNELEKISARRGMKEIVKLLRSGNVEKAHAMAKAPGVIKSSPAGSQIKDLGKGSEGLATLVAHPEHGLAARKLYDPQGMASPEMISRKEQAGKAIGNNPNFAKFHGSAKTPQGGTMHLNEYVPGSTAKGDLKNQSIRNTKAQALRAVRGAGFHGAQDIRSGNMIKTPEGQHKVIDYMPSHKGEFERASTLRKANVPDHALVPTDKANGLLNSQSLNLSAGQLKAQQFRGVAPQMPKAAPMSPAQQAMPTAVSPNRKPIGVPAMPSTKLAPTVKM